MPELLLDQHGELLINGRRADSGAYSAVPAIAPQDAEWRLVPPQVVLPQHRAWRFSVPFFALLGGAAFGAHVLGAQVRR